MAQSARELAARAVRLERDATYHRLVQEGDRDALFRWFLQVSAEERESASRLPAHLQHSHIPPGGAFVLEVIIAQDLTCTFYMEEVVKIAQCSRQTLAAVPFHRGRSTKLQRYAWDVLMYEAHFVERAEAEAALEEARRPALCATCKVNEAWHRVVFDECFECWDAHQ